MIHPLLKSRHNARFHKMFCRIAVILLTVLSAGCGDSGEPLDAARLQRDEALWNSRGPADYDLQWRSTSTRNNAVYRVYVRGGQVRSVRLVRPDGKAIALKPAEPGFYSVPGLFRTIREELAQSQQAQPFGQPQGTTVLLTVRSDPTYGYPTFYRRDIFGVNERMGLDVTRFEPSQAEIPPADEPR